jgi:chromosome segregation ATPase
MDEARRLTAEMDARAKLLAELERELASLEGERNEALLALQDARAVIEVGNQERESLRQEVSTRDRALADSLAEEERLAGELEEARDQAENLRRSLEALNTERDVLARQVADLTAERTELLEARKALESVHRALTQATVR